MSNTHIFLKLDNEEIAQKCKKVLRIAIYGYGNLYNFKLLNPNDKLSVFIKQTDLIGTVLTATQTGEKKI